MKRNFKNMKYCLTTLFYEEKKYYKDNGFYVYDLRESCFYGDGGTIAPSVLINNVGNIITDQDLGSIDTWDEISLDDVIDTATMVEINYFDEIIKYKQDLEMEVL